MKQILILTLIIAMTAVSCQKPTEEENLVGETYINQSFTNSKDVKRTLVFKSETELTINVNISGSSVSDSYYTFTLEGNTLIVTSSSNKTYRWNLKDDRSTLTTHDNLVYQRQ